LDAFTSAAAAATTVGQAEGGLGGIAATATAPPFIPSGAALVTGAPAPAGSAPADGGSGGSGGNNTSSGSPPQSSKPSSALATGVNSAVLFLATLFGMAVVL
jgi:hypothetical protein